MQLAASVPACSEGLPVVYEKGRPQAAWSVMRRIQRTIWFSSPLA